MRLFLAVSPASEWRRHLSARVDALRDELAGERSWRWADPATWHLTLQFLGDWPRERVEGLLEQLSSLQPVAPFTINTGALDAFPDLRRPRVLFLHQESQGQAEELARLVRDGVQSAWPGGPQDHKAFRAHLTLARVKGELGSAAGQALSRWSPGELPPWPVTAFQLVESQLHSAGARHRVVASFPLSNA